MSEKLQIGPHILVALTAVAAPLALGGAHAPTRAVLAAMVGIALLWGVVAANRRLKFDSIAWALAVALGWTCIQLLPLPISWVQAFGSPSALAHNEAAAALGQAPPTMVSMAIHPGAAADMALYLFTALGTYLVASNTRAGRRRTMVKAVVFAALAVALIGLGHKALKATALFGVYEPQMALNSLPLPTTLINGNHAAALLLLGAAGAAALAVSGDSKRGVPMFWAISLACSAGVVATQSLACTLLLGGIIVALLIRRWVKTREIVGAWRVLLGVAGLLVIGAAAVVTIVLGGESLTGRWDLGANVARDYWGSGVGAGGFPMVVSQYQTHWADGQLTYAHNGLLQAISDWGLPVTMLVLGLLCLGLWRIVRHTRADVHYMIIVLAVVAVALANLVEFSLWLPGVGLPALVLLAWPAGEARRLMQRAKDKASDKVSGRAEKRAEARLTWPARGVVAVAIVSIVSLSSLALSDTMEASHDQVRAIAGETNAAVSPLVTLAQTHPSDYFVWWSAARRLAQQGDPRAAGFVDRALQLAPHHPQTLQLCGLYSARKAALDCLLALSRQSLKLRYRSAQIAIARGAGDSAEPSYAQEFAAGRGIAAIAVADTLKRAQGVQAYEEALRWAYKQHPVDPGVAERLVLLWLDNPARKTSLNGLSTTLLARGATVEDKEVGARLRRLGYLALGVVTLRDDGDARTAAQAFEASAREWPDDAALPLERAIRAWLTAGTPDRAVTLTTQLNTLAKRKDSPASARAVAHELTSLVAHQRGELDVAIAELRRALAYHKESPRLHRLLAALFAETGSPKLAQQARDKADRLAGSLRTAQ